MVSANGNRDVEKENFWRARLERQKASGLSQSAFCRNEGLRENRFCYWKHVIEKRQRKAASTKNKTTQNSAQQKSAKTGFIPLVVANDLPPVLENNDKHQIKLLIAQIQVGADARPETVRAIVESFKI
jgi:hypothetical protein